MYKVRRFMLLTAMAGQLCWQSFTFADDAAWAQVTPEETDEILANPGMGWETFHRTADNDSNLPSWIPSTVQLPDDLQSGTYTLSIAVVGVEESDPVVQLGIKGRAKDGWYPVSTVAVSK